MDVLSARQKLVASNIANVDTPGFKTQDLDFQSEFNSLVKGESTTLHPPGSYRTPRQKRRKQCQSRPRSAPALRKLYSLLCSQQSDERPTPNAQERYSRRAGRVSLFSSLSVSASGMNAQRVRAELLVENLANAETTRTPEGGPYRRKDVVFQSQAQQSPFASVLSDQMTGNDATGVTVSDVIVDQRDPEKRYLPGHPDANADGYVAFPRLNPAEEMVDLVSSSRGYQANVASMTSIKEMIQRSIDLLK
jgi:flagellar basal-body rod protein FlgC